MCHTLSCQGEFAKLTAKTTGVGQCVQAWICLQFAILWFGWCLTHKSMLKLHQCWQQSAQTSLVYRALVGTKPCAAVPRVEQFFMAFLACKLSPVADSVRHRFLVLWVQRGVGFACGSSLDVKDSSPRVTQIRSA